MLNKNRQIVVLTFYFSAIHITWIIKLVVLEQASAGLGASPLFLVFGSAKLTSL